MELRLEKSTESVSRIHAISGISTKVCSPFHLDDQYSSFTFSTSIHGLF